MNNLKTILKSFTFRFKDCIFLLDRNIVCSSMYVGFLVLILSFCYNFNYLVTFLGYYKVYDLIEYFSKDFLKEFIISIVFLIILSFNIYIISKYFLNKIKYNVSIKNIFNIFCHIYTILFILDLFFIITFKDLKLSDNIQEIYVWSSIVVSIITLIFYPMLFLRYLSKNNINIISSCERKINFINEYSSNKFIITIKKYINSILNILLLKDNIYVDILKKKHSYNYFISFIFISVVFSILKLKLNPDVINLNNAFTLKSYTAAEIFENYFKNTYFLILGIILISLINWIYLKFNKNYICILKISAISLYVIIFLILGELFKAKIISFSSLAPSILPSQLIAEIISLLTYVSIIYIIFFFIKRIFYLYLNK